MKLDIVLDNQPVVAHFLTDGHDFFDIAVMIGRVYFVWDQFSPLQQEQILTQLKQKWNERN